MKVIIADDHALIREGLERTLNSFEEEISVIHAEDRDTVLEALSLHDSVDMLLLDLYMPGSNGLELLRHVCQCYPTIPVVVISASDDPLHIRKSIDAGASGFIPKSASNEIMLNAIKLVRSGGVFIPHELLKPACHDTGMQEDIKPGAPVLIHETIHAAEKLTVRQREVLDLMSRGMSNKEIARGLGLSEHTVKIHVTAVLKLFNAENRTEAVVMAHNAGILDV